MIRALVFLLSDSIKNGGITLPAAVREQLKKKLVKVIEAPHIPKNMLHGGLVGCYKIKLLKAGVRLVYQVKDDEVVILLITVGKRADSVVYDEATKRIND